MELVSKVRPMFPISYNGQIEDVIFCFAIFYRMRWPLVSSLSNEKIWKRMGHFCLRCLCQIWNYCHEDAIVEFKKLQQKESINDYQDKFEELRTLLGKSQHISEDYFMSSSLSGLNKEVCNETQMFKPNSFITFAIEASKRSRFRANECLVSHG